MEYEILMILGSQSQTKIAIRYKDEDTAKTVNLAIKPDNINLPEEIQIVTTVKGSSLLIEIESNRSLGSFINTLDDILSCVQAAEKALGELDCARA
jgi:hypothetical protein